MYNHKLLPKTNEGIFLLMKLIICGFKISRTMITYLANYFNKKYKNNTRLEVSPKQGRSYILWTIIGV
jgi:hypothetical protein